MRDNELSAKVKYGCNYINTSNATTCYHDSILSDHLLMRWFFYVRERPHVRGLTPGRVNPEATL
eukprot:scaffold3114_cov65-Skeletonema_menzelii.AAC.1